jgi:hypothetical protein
VEKVCGVVDWRAEALVEADCTVFSYAPASGKSANVLVLVWPSAVRTTARPSPTGKELPSVVVTTPSPVSETTVTCEVAGSAVSATTKVSPAFTGEIVPRVVTITTEAWAKLSGLESRTKEPLFSVSLVCGKGFPEGSTEPPSIVSPTTNSLEGCSSIKRPSANRRSARPSLPATTMAPAGSTSLILVEPSTGMSLKLTTTPPSDEASTALVEDSAVVTVQRTALTTQSQEGSFTTAVMRAASPESTSFGIPCYPRDGDPSPHSAVPAPGA